MVEIFGKKYYIDLESISERCKIHHAKNEDGDNVTEINIFKYEIIKMCLDRLLNEFDEVDEEMGVFSQKQSSISFRIAFNTLIKNNILLEEEDE